MTAPAWTITPTAEQWCAVVDSAEYAAHGDRTRSAGALIESGQDVRVLAVVGIRLLAGVLAEGVSADEIRREVLALASCTGAPDRTVNAALETLGMAEALTRDDWAAVDALCAGSQIAVVDIVVMATALAGQAISSSTDDVAGAFYRLREAWGAA
ncbi:hypothetical protein [Mycolicibacterium alvei]|uniref:Uncharacterized protein n=1 Tax=Mycolicibacterium alvei TaxID=67081 RepID=A0A6N4UME2_9MYCO|nr:hypothetical protein [Mycolicibacterium alvei]MCV7004139.1 hypothetical protein [Mycolicibacterium alvei]BBX25990.1 hypothetical protein MALV_11150 [Mycolicibacterium alvei]